MIHAQNDTWPLVYLDGASYPILNPSAGQNGLCSREYASADCNGRKRDAEFSDPFEYQVSFLESSENVKSAQRNHNTPSRVSQHNQRQVKPRQMKLDLCENMRSMRQGDKIIIDIRTR